MNQYDTPARQPLNGKLGAEALQLLAEAEQLLAAASYGPAESGWLERYNELQRQLRQSHGAHNG